MYFNEEHISQIPALILLQKIGYTYLTPDEALKQRGRKQSNVLLEDILLNQLRLINSFTYKGRTHKFSEGAISGALQALKVFRYDGLISTNEQIYDLLSLGKSFEQTVDGDTKSFTINYIDWKNPENNVFHVTEEFAVERSGSYETFRPDIVLFVNGIPLVVIECKKPEEKDSIAQAISQHIRNQKDDGITRLFVYSQLLLAVNKNEAKYATTGTPYKFWSVWKEENDITDEVSKIINNSLEEEKMQKMFYERDENTLAVFESKAHYGLSKITEQDKTLYSLCRPDRILELTYKYIVFDAGEKKIARYQQYNAVRKAIRRVLETDSNGKRRGGVIWHTQGSGKSLTMVMLAKAISLEPSIKNPKIIIVTDRKDLDEQIEKTFRKCGKHVVRAKSGRNLSTLIREDKETIITTLIHKFNSIVKNDAVYDLSNNIFVLVDEGHRTQYGSFHVKMHKVFPNACYIGFTGTPLMKREKNTAARFGGIIDTYNIDQAVKDKAVVPLLYEGRYVEQEVYEKAIDAWWERVCKGLTLEQQADLKRKFARADQLNKAEKKIARIAYDISDHFKRNWSDTGFKAQIAADSKTSAIKFKKYLDEFGMVTSEVIISSPDMREGYTEIDEENNDMVRLFWDKMMSRFKTEEEYNRQIINKFKGPEPPEIIIVVDKLLTGFDAPRNTVLYIAKNLREHNLLQAIARVNRLFEGKDFGYIIDYYGILGELDKALTTYGGLSDFDENDLESTLTNINEEISKLPQRHSDLLDIFKTIENKYDEEAYEVHLADDDIRDNFYKRLTDFAKTLKIALSSVKFSEETSESKINKYKSDLAFFVNLRSAVKRRYAEMVNYGEYEGKIQKLIDEYVVAEEIINITDLVNIFDIDKFEEELQKIQGKAARADTIANRTKKTISEKWNEDPAFYKKFSKLLEEVIDEYRQRRIDEAQYLEKVTEIMIKVRDKEDSDIPESVKYNDDARAFYGLVYEVFQEIAGEDKRIKDLAGTAGLEINDIINSNKIVGWEENIDVEKQMEQEIDDYLFELKEEIGFELSIDAIDKLIENIIRTAKNRSRRN
ncbi:MAG TPA: type I restriction endonuclease subunit R [Bacteroidetes bacterium]|nr:type I restriction endonuclease subunit R [Bacteroidota bacterium]